MCVSQYFMCVACFSNNHILVLVQVQVLTCSSPAGLRAPVNVQVLHVVREIAFSFPAELRAPGAADFVLQRYVENQS